VVRDGEEALEIRVEAPTALLGFLLTLKLQGHNARVVEAEDGGCVVEIEAGASRAWVLGCVQRWLDEEALQQVVVHVDGESYTVTQTRRSFPTSARTLPLRALTYAVQAVRIRSGQDTSSVNGGSTTQPSSTTHAR